MPQAQTLDELSDSELETMVRSCEARLLAGTSSHHDMLALIESELEIARRQRARSRREGRAFPGGGKRCSQSGDDDALVIVG